MAARKAKKSNKSPRKVARPRTRPDAPQDSDVFLLPSLTPTRAGGVAPAPVVSDVFVVGALPDDWDASATDAPLDDSDVAVFAPMPVVPEDADHYTGELPPDFVMDALDLDPDSAEPWDTWQRPVRLPASYTTSYQKLLNWTCEHGCAGIVTPDSPSGQHAPNCGYWKKNPNATPF